MKLDTICENITENIILEMPEIDKEVLVQPDIIKAIEDSFSNFENKHEIQTPFEEYNKSRTKRSYTKMRFRQNWHWR